jgi:hypothetical protein
VENFFFVQCLELRKRATIEDARTNTGVICSIHRQAARQHDRVAKHASAISLEVKHGKIAHRGSNRKTCVADE